jgi:hypothetical protein
MRQIPIVGHATKFSKLLKKVMKNKEHLRNCYSQDEHKSQVLVAIILVIWEAAIRRIIIRSQPGQIVLETLS